MTSSHIVILLLKCFLLLQYLMITLFMICWSWLIKIIIWETKGGKCTTFLLYFFRKLWHRYRNTPKPASPSEGRCSTRQVPSGGWKKALPRDRKHQRHCRVQGEVRDHQAHKRRTVETADRGSPHVQQGQVQGHLRQRLEWLGVSGTLLRHRTFDFSKRSMKRVTDVNSGLICID